MWSSSQSLTDYSVPLRRVGYWTIPRQVLSSWAGSSTESHSLLLHALAGCAENARPVAHRLVRALPGESSPHDLIIRDSASACR